MSSCGPRSHDGSREPAIHGSETAEEIEDGGVGFLRALLLGPVTAAGEDEGLAKLRHKVRKIGDELVHAAEGDNQVPVADDVECRDADLHSGERSQEFPAAVDVAIPVETSAEACAPKFVTVEVDVRLGEPLG